MTRSCGHKSHDSWKDIEGSEKDEIIQQIQHMLTLRLIHGYLG